MWSHLYLIFVFVVLCYDIIRDVFFFNKGQYNPYPFRKQEKEPPFGIVLSINLLIVIGMFTLITKTDFRILIYIFLIFSFCRVLCTSVMNYLSYKKFKVRKIISHTIIFDIIIISFSIGIWLYITK